MEKNNLTGIERELALQYLMDGNVPVTVTLVGEEKNDEVHHVLSEVLPVVVQSSQMTLLKNEIIVLKEPAENVTSLVEKIVRIEFYFHSVGLFFETTIKKIKQGLAFVVPEVIHRVKNIAAEKQVYDFFASIYYSCSNKSTVNFDCVPEKDFSLFEKPVWKSIPLENQMLAKTYLEQFVSEARLNKVSGTGIQLIPICKYLSTVKSTLQELQGVVKPFAILYVDHERIVLGNDSENFPLVKGTEYALKLSFSLKEGPTLQEEDRRFLYEKATKKLFV